MIVTSFTTIVLNAQTLANVFLITPVRINIVTGVVTITLLDLVDYLVNVNQAVMRRMINDRII